MNDAQYDFVCGGSIRGDECIFGFLPFQTNSDLTAEPELW